MLDFLRLRMIPISLDLGLLVLRLGFGLSLLLLHGFGKASNFSGMAPQFIDPWGLGPPFTLSLSIAAELVCAGLVAIGLFTRLAALICIINMLAAFWYGHHARLTGQQNGELAFLYLMAFLVIFVAGPGRYAVDRRMGGPAG